MLDPAPPPEGGGRSAVAVRHAQDAQGDGRTVRRAVQGRRLLQRGHGRTDRLGCGPQRGKLLLPRNEHPSAGGTSRDRGHRGHRSGRTDDPRRLWREACVHAGRGQDRRLGDREPGLCRRSLSRLPAQHRAAGALQSASCRGKPGTVLRRCLDFARHERRWSGFQFSPGSVRIERSRDAAGLHPRRRQLPPVRALHRRLHLQRARPRGSP